MSVLLKLRFA